MKEEISRPTVVFVAGLSGSGKSTAMAALEDLGFYGMDHLPAELLRQFLDLCAKTTPRIEKIALALDSRHTSFLEDFPSVVEEIRGGDSDVEVIFLECTNEVLERRYRETRRVHPLSPAGSVEEGIEKEREALSDARQIADFVIDTTSLNVHQLKEAVVRRVSGAGREIVVNIVSFGFRFGTPKNLELLFDLRCLPNPYFEEALRSRSGEDEAVADYVLQSPSGKAFFERILDLVRFLLPLYDQEGKAYLTIGLGCTGGRHRSVAVARALEGALRKIGRETNLEHRDCFREENESKR